MVYLQSSAIELNKKRAHDNAPISQTMLPNEETSFCDWEGVEKLFYPHILSTNIRRVVE